jgi:hypothetical protein
MLPALLLCLTAAKCQGNDSHPAGSRQFHREYRYARHLFGSGEIGCLVSLWRQESGWNADAVNGLSGAYGIPQANPHYFGHPFALGAWRAQIRWGKRYLDRRYGGSPCAAWSHEEADSWY